MTHTFDRLKIIGYRGFEALDLSDLGQVNIFVGDNNSGKTSLLEVIAILCDPFNPFRWLEISQRRGYAGRTLMTFRPDLEAMKWIFPQTTNTLDSESYSGEIFLEAFGKAAIEKLDAKLGSIYSLGTEKSLENRYSDETDIALSVDEVDADSDSMLSGLELEVTAS